MDPISALTIAGKSASIAQDAWTVGQTLWKFAHDTKRVDETVANLASEARQLGDTCDLVEWQLEDLVPLYNGGSGRQERRENSLDGNATRQKALASERPRQLLSNLSTQLSECEKAVESLDAAIEPVRRNRSNIITQAWRQIRLHMTKGDIQETRFCIASHKSASHKSALHTTLLTIVM